MPKRHIATLRLGEVSRGRNNNLNLMRLLAAVGVVYGHAFGTGNHTAEEPFFRAFGVGVGDISVDVFFLISGFLVSKSFLSKNLLQFAWARARRIYPALWASTIFLVAVCGLLFSPLPATEFWSRHSTLTYVSRNIAMLPVWGGQITLPYAFNSTETEFNTPLWTLPYELQMYLLLALVGIAGWLRSPALAGGLAIGGACLYLMDAAFGLHFASLDRWRFLYFFFTGTVAYLARDHIPMRGSILLASAGSVVLVLALTTSSLLRQAALAVALPYMVLWLSFMPAGFIRRYNQAGDYSYGVYILAAPIQVLLGLRLPEVSPMVRFALALAAVAPLAMLSWHCLESRALGVARSAPSH